MRGEKKKILLHSKTDNKQKIFNTRGKKYEY